MNLIFHDRTTLAPEPGAAVLTIERKGNFYFSAGAVRALKLTVDALVLPVEDTDSKQWYMLLHGGPAMNKHKPFTLRAVGGKNGSRLVFSSTARARAYYTASNVPASVNAVQLTISMEPIEVQFVGSLRPLTPTTPSRAAAVAKAVAAVPLSTAERQPTVTDTERVLERIRTTVQGLGSLNLRNADKDVKNRALGLLSKHEALLASVKGAPELYAALQGER